MTLRLRDTDYPSYRATIVNADRSEVFSKSGLTPHVTKKGALLIFKVPAKQLSPHDYVVTVYGGPAGAANESIADYVFHVIR